MSLRDIPIIMYHCINDESDAKPLGFLGFTSTEFREHLRYFKLAGFECVSISELLRRAKHKSFPDRPMVALTFDDGYLDNLLIAADIMDEFGARGTVFATLDFVEPGDHVRTRSEVKNIWGYMNEAELRAIDRRGTIEVQSHTVTHNREFASDRLIGFYTPDQFDLLYWLAWKLFPADKPNWFDRIEELRARIPSGYPVFENGWAIPTRRFTPSESFVQEVIDRFEREGAGCLSALNAESDKGILESVEAWRERSAEELSGSKRRLETLLGREVDVVCFPGGGYDDHALATARTCGYRCFMYASRERQPGNVGRLREGASGNGLIGLSRVSFTKNFPAVFRGRWSAYWTCRLRMREVVYGYEPGAMRRLARSIRRRLGWIGR